MSASVVVFVYASAVIIAIIGILAYFIWLKKNHTESSSPELENTGLPIKGGTKHFKVVNSR